MRWHKEWYMRKRLYVFLPLFLSLTMIIGACAGQTANRLPPSERQTTDTVLMVSPDDFAFNQETAQSNVFQKRDTDTASVNKRAISEFGGMVRKLESSGIRVIQVPSRGDIKTPDAVFPNNWFSIHKISDQERILVGYPMLAPNRRAERRLELLNEKLRSKGMNVTRTIDLSRYEEKGLFLEGTGSMVLDRVNRIAYVALSPRTNREVLDDFAAKLSYRPVAFRSSDAGGNPIYHTNVMMSVGEGFAVICLESIEDRQEGMLVLKELKQAGKKIIPITLSQLQHMCGNILELRAKEAKIIVMSQTAYDHFTPQQKIQLSLYGTILPVDIRTIETIGGGSARCMLGEVF